MATSKKLAIISHGLNLLPERMSEIQGYLSSIGHKTLMVTLPGHSQKSGKSLSISWLEINQYLQKVFSRIEQLSKQQNIEVNLYLYSFGAPCFLKYLILNEKLTKSLNIKNIYLISPALKLRFAPSFMFSVLHYFPDKLNHFSLKSRNHELYKVHDNVSYGTYKELGLLIKEVNHSLYCLRNVKFHLLMDPKDELLSYTATQDLFTRHNMTFTSNKLTKVNAPLKPNFYHLGIDSRSLGIEGFNRLLSHIEAT